MKPIIEKSTRLETAEPQEIEAILDHKLETTSAHQVADYAALSIDNIENRIAEIKSAEQELKALRSALADQADIVKSGVASWLADTGLSKLQGNIVSSISVLVPKPSYDLVVDDEAALINAGYFKTVLDKTAVKNALLADEEIPGAHLDVTHHQEKIKVNRRKKANSEPQPLQKSA